MDIISLQKAMKAKRAVKSLKDRLGEGVQDVHANVKTRLEKLEEKDPHVEIVNRVSELEAVTAANINKHNLRMNTLLNKNRYNLTELAFDDFGDATGIDASKSINQVFDVAGKKVVIGPGGSEAEVVTVAETLLNSPTMIVVSQVSNTKTTDTKSVNFEDGLKTNIDLAGGKIQLLSLGDQYSPVGTFESAVIDLGENFKSIDKVESALTTPAGTSVQMLTTTSDNSVTFSEYLPLNTDGTLASPSGRYIKVKAELTGGYKMLETLAHDFTVEEKIGFQDNEYIVFNGDAKLKTSYSYAMQVDGEYTESGTLLRKAINKASFRSIEKVEVA